MNAITLTCISSFLLCISLLWVQSGASAIREQLLQDFLPDDMCPLGAQIFADSPGLIYQTNSTANESSNKVPVLCSFRIVYDYLLVF